MSHGLDASSAGQEIKKKYEDSNKPTVEPIYLINVSNLTAVTVLDGDASDRNWDLPWVIKNSEAGKLWIGDAQNQKTLAAWGSAYKKHKLGIDSGRSQQSIDDAAARERADKFFEKHTPTDLVDLSAIEGGAAFTKDLGIVNATLT